MTTKDHHMGDDAALRRSPGGNMTKDAAEVAREIVSVVGQHIGMLYGDWELDREGAATDVESIILSERKAARAEERERIAAFFENIAAVCEAIGEPLVQAVVNDIRAGCGSAPQAQKEKV